MYTLLYLPTLRFKDIDVRLSAFINNVTNYITHLACYLKLFIQLFIYVILITFSCRVVNKPWDNCYIPRCTLISSCAMYTYKTVRSIQSFILLLMLFLSLNGEMFADTKGVSNIHYAITTWKHTIIIFCRCSINNHFRRKRTCWRIIVRFTAGL